MSDDLSAFFAKKKDKKKGKKIVKIDDVGHLLEKKVKKQEERDREEEEHEKNGENDERVERGPNEESDWIEYDNTINSRVEGLRLKDLGQEDTEEESQETGGEGETQVQVEPTKTWGVVEKNSTSEEMIPSANEYKVAQQKYVAPGRFSHSTAKIDINNQEMFPTFAAAEQIEKIKKDEEKNPWGKVGGGGGANVAPSGGPGKYVPPRGDSDGAWRTQATRDRESAISAARQMGSTAQPPVQNIRPPAPAEPTLRKAPNAYVPPHLRGK